MDAGATTLWRELALFGAFAAVLVVSIVAARDRALGLLLRGAKRLSTLSEPRFAVLLIVLAIGPRLVASLALPDALSSDAYWYHARAVDLLEGRGYVRPGPIVDGRMAMIPTAFWPVGYSAFLAAVYAVVGASWRIGVVLNAVLAGAGIFVVYRVARHCVGVVPARVAALLMCACPALLARSLLSEPFYGVLLCSAVWWALARRPDWRTAVGVGVLLAAATYVKVNALPFLLLPVFIWWARLQRMPGAAQRMRETVRLAGICALTVGVCCLPWTVRNGKALGAFVPTTTSGGVAMLLGAHDGADGREPPRYDAPVLTEVIRLRLEAFDEVGSDAAAKRLAYDWIAANPLRWLGLGAAKVAWTMLLPPWEPPLYWHGDPAAPAPRIEWCLKAASQVFTWATLCGFLVYAVTLAGQAWRHRSAHGPALPAHCADPHSPLLALPFLAWIVTIGQAFAFVGYGRLRMPIEGLLIAAGVWAVWHWLPQRAAEGAVQRRTCASTDGLRRTESPLPLGADTPDLLHSPV